MHHPAKCSECQHHHRVTLISCCFLFGREATLLNEQRIWHDPICRRPERDCACHCLSGIVSSLLYTNYPNTTVVYLLRPNNDYWRLLTFTSVRKTRMRWRRHSNFYVPMIAGKDSEKKLCPLPHSVSCSINKTIRPNGLSSPSSCANLKAAEARL